MQIRRLSSGKRFWKVVIQKVAVIKLRVNNRCGNGTGSFEVKIGADTTKYTNVIITRIRWVERQEKFCVVSIQMLI